MKHLSLVSLELIPKAEPVPLDNLLDIFKIAVSMENLCQKESGIGLSAVQCGIPWSFFVVNRNDQYEYYLNCEYVGLGEKVKSIEGCLSLRNKSGELRRFEVDRFNKVNILGKELKVVDGKLVLFDVDKTEEDLYAVVFQHEIDHNFKREKMIDKIGKELELIRS